MKKFLVSVVSAFLFVGSTSAWADGDTTVTTGATATSNVVAHGSAVNNMNVDGTATAPSMGGGQCDNGIGIGVVGLSLGTSSPNFDCLAVTTVAEMVRVGALTPAEAKAIWLFSVGIKIEQPPASTVTAPDWTAIILGLSPELRAVYEGCGQIDVTLDTGPVTIEKANCTPIN